MYVCMYVWMYVCKEVDGRVSRLHYSTNTTVHTILQTAVPLLVSLQRLFQSLTRPFCLITPSVSLRIRFHWFASCAL